MRGSSSGLFFDAMLFEVKFNVTLCVCFAEDVRYLVAILRVQLLLINPLPVKSFARYTLHTLPIKSPGKAHEERVDARLPGPEWFVS